MKPFVMSALVAALLAAGACSPGQPEQAKLGTERPPNEQPDRADSTSGTAADVLSQIENRKGRIEVALTAGNLPEARNLTAELRELVSALELRASELPAEDRGRLSGAVARVAAAARALEQAAANNQGPAADREFERLKDALRELGSIPIPSE